MLPCSLVARSPRPPGSAGWPKSPSTGGRVQRLEQAAPRQDSEEGTLIVWRRPAESKAEALARYAGNLANHPHAQVHVRLWTETDRLAAPPRPVWCPTHEPPGVGEELARALLKAN